jgi:ABC-type dipeptide/oligopeptide/nickel transport system ATPase component
MEIRLRIIRESPILAIYNRTFWSEADGRLFINLGGPEVFIITDEDHIERSYNGECGLMFKTNPSGKYLTPDFDAERTDAWDRLVNDLSFTTSTEAPAHPEEQRELLKAWILAFFFQEMMPTKPILSLLGVPGSGKTTAIRRILRILEDPNADVLGVPTDKQDAFRATIEKHRLIVIDNLEKSGVGWMVDLLNKLATGNHIEIRELYRTNATHLIAPDCFVALTAVNIPFSDETLFSRMLVLEMQRLSEPMPEHVLQNTIREFGPAIWADLMRKLGKVVAILRSKPKVRPPTKSRLVDFTVFCEKIKNCDVVRCDQLSSGLLAMVDSQLHQLRQSSQAVFLLEEWLTLKPAEAAEWRTIEQIYSVLNSMAQVRRLTFQWKNSAALQRHISTLESRLKADFAAEIKMEESPQTGRETMRIRFKNMLI